MDQKSSYTEFLCTFAGGHSAPGSFFDYLNEHIPL